MAFDLSLSSNMLNNSLFGAGATAGGGNNYGLGTPQMSPEQAIVGSGGADKSFFSQLSPANIAAIGGMIGQAIGGNTVGGRLSAVASAVGQTHLKALASQEQQKQQMAFLKDLLGKGGNLGDLTPEQAKALGISPKLLIAGADDALLGR